MKEDKKKDLSKKSSKGSRGDSEKSGFCFYFLLIVNRLELLFCCNHL